jgi:lipopolysaccharide transport protein LptA
MAKHQIVSVQHTKENGGNAMTLRCRLKSFCCHYFPVFLYSTLVLFSPSPLRADLIEEKDEETSAAPSGGPTTKPTPQPTNLLHEEAKSGKPINTPKPKSTQESQTPSTVVKAPSAEPAKLNKSESDRNKNSDAPVSFQSQGASGDKAGGILILEKDVVVTQNDLKITADKATITINKATNEVKTVYAVGNVHFFRKDPETGLPVTSNSHEAEFDNLNRTIVLKGDPKMMRGTDIVKGKQIIYDLNTGWVKATRVMGVVQPKKTTDQPKPLPKSATSTEGSPATQDEDDNP